MDILKFSFSQIFLRAIHGRVVTIYKFDFNFHNVENHFVKNSIELDNLEVIVEIYFDHL
jgi:hypothetical protein